MLRHITAVGVILLAGTSALSAQDAAETQAWEVAQRSGASTDVFAFLETYPNSVYAKDAKALMIDLLWAELGENNPTPEAEVVSEDVAVSVSFSAPLTEGAADIIGKSLEELIKGTPLFPPVEGLPEEYWKTQDCSNCHAWEQANLCTQANSYLNDAGAENLIKQHPYGGTFKLNLRNWAIGGCE